MSRRFRQEQADIYATEQVRRTLLGSGIKIESELDNDFIIFCPYHNNYRTPAGEVTKDTGRFYCFSCGQTATLHQLVMHTTNKTYFEAVRLIKEYESEIDIASIVDSMIEEVPEFIPYDELLIRRLHTQALDSPRAMRYFEGRRISENSVKRFLLGYSDKQDMVTIPVSSPDGSMFIGFVARSVEGKEFKNTPGMPKSKTMFNLDKAKRFSTVYVVESSFDAIRLDQNGVAAVATLGATVSNRQCELLQKYFNNVIVIGDNDDAGKNMQAKVLEKLGNRATLISIPSRFKDIGDMTDADIQELTKRIEDPLLSMFT